jgi:hypothetical protein
MAAGRSRIELSYSPREPNFRVLESVSETGTPLQREERKDSVKVAKVEAAKTLQSMLKVQKVFGLDISYEKRAPPMGAPKAAATPAEAPAAINCLLVTSF